MKALRIILHQTSANYRKEETIDNRMTYPLPPISTVIGALHKACGYNEYHAMDISIQGGFESKHKEPYTDYCFLNSTMDDRGILVKMRNETMLSNAFDKVASAKKSQGNSFRKGITIQVHNQGLLEEYQNLKNLADEIKEFKDKRIRPIKVLIKKRKNTLSKKKKLCVRNSPEYQVFEQREKEIKELEKKIDTGVKEYERLNYTIPVAKYRSLTTSLKFYEVLDEVTLILHVRAEENILADIQNNIFNLKAIGRSEDFVNVMECEVIELEESEDEVTSNYSQYVDIDLVRGDDMTIYQRSDDSSRVFGTKYMLNKDYHIVDGQRIFNKKKVLYISQHSIDETDAAKNLYADGNYIVNFL